MYNTTQQSYDIVTAYDISDRLSYGFHCLHVFRTTAISQTMIECIRQRVMDKREGVRWYWQLCCWLRSFSTIRLKYGIPFQSYLFSFKWRSVRRVCWCFVLGSEEGGMARQKKRNAKGCILVLILECSFYVEAIVWQTIMCLFVMFSFLWFYDAAKKLSDANEI